MKTALHHPAGRYWASDQFVVMASATPILPGATVKVVDATSIYNGYTGFVQRISGDRAAVLFEGGNWDKLITLRLRDLQAA